MRPNDDGVAVKLARSSSPRVVVARRIAATCLVTLVSLLLWFDAGALAQETIALKSGESVVIGPVFYVSHCKSILTATPEVEILEGPPELTLSIKDDMVLPRRFNCPAKVPGGILTATAGAVTATTHTKLTYRVKYKTKDGDRQLAHVFNIELFP